jgi:shikimate kinase
VSLPGIRRILLVGFMGSGKSSVGKELAAALGWRFVDADEAVESRMDRPISEVFRTLGEGYFREMEREVMDGLVQDSEVVVATGGGWAAQLGWDARVPSGSTTVWLQVAAEEAVRRTRSEPGLRPLLDSEEPLVSARELVRKRTASYALAQWKVDT